jgi:preprotein translocase subunit SecG
METLILVIHVLVAVALVGVVLLQHGKGADVGAAFGSGASGSLFGAAGSANFLSRTTAVLAVVFFLTSLTLTWFSGKKVEDRGLMGAKSATEQPLPAQIPAAPQPPAASQSAAPGAGAPAAGAAGEGGSRAQDVPK